MKTGGTHYRVGSTAVALDIVRQQILEDIGRWRHELSQVRQTLAAGIGKKCYAAAERIVSMSTRILLRHTRDGWVTLEDFAAAKHKPPDRLTFGEYITLLQRVNVSVTGSLVKNKIPGIRLTGNLVREEDFRVLRSLSNDRNRFVHEDASPRELEFLFEQIRNLCNSQFCLAAVDIERRQ